MEEENEWEDYPSVEEGWVEGDPKSGKFCPNGKSDYLDGKDEYLTEKEARWMSPSLKMAMMGFRGKKMKNMFDMPHSTVQETSLAYQLYMKLIASTEGDVFFARVNLSISKKNKSFPEIVRLMKGLIDKPRATMPYDDRCTIIQGERHGSPVLLWITIEDHAEVHRLRVDITSSPEAVEYLFASIDKLFENEKMGLIKWWVNSGRGPETRDFFLPKSNIRILPEYYPDLVSPEKYLSDFMASDEAVLLIAGPPGTGKTTFLRHLIASYKLSADVVYDENLMQKDTVFQHFLFDKESDVMVIEDADTILSSRERDGNKLMARFLNVSDGLIKLPNKKLIFTTNIADFGNVDPALLRPGRCFGVVHTRALNLIEAQAAANVAGLPIPVEKREYTIAELFNQGKRQSVRNIGFGVRH